MDIVYHCTDNYARITSTSIISLFENNKDAEEINVYIIEHGFTSKTKNKITMIATKYARNIFFIPLPDINLEYGLGLISIKDNWMFDSYSRLFLDQILPANISRVLYLDGDILVLDSLKMLWNMDLQGKCCAAVLDCMGDSYYQYFEMNPQSCYCNSGVILIDINMWKEQSISEKVKDYVNKKRGYVFFMEQTVFNVVLQNQIAYLPAEYNVSTLMQTMTYEEMIQLRRPRKFYSKEEVNIALSHPVILHMTGFFYVINRAWNKVTNHPAKSLFMEFSKKLNSIEGWDDMVLQEDRRDLKAKLRDFGIHFLPKAFVIRIVCFIYNDFRIIKIKRQSRRMIES